MAKRHITDDAAGYKILLDLLVEYGDSEENPIPVAIESSRGQLVAVLRTGQRKVFAINPMAAARYRDRHSVSRKKSDPGDALVLGTILPTDMHAHRPLPNDSDLGRAIAVLARAQQDSLWNRQQLSNQLRSLLPEYYPATLAAFGPWRNGLYRPEAQELLKAASTPTRARASAVCRVTAVSSTSNSSPTSTSAASGTSAKEARSSPARTRCAQEQDDASAKAASHPLLISDTTRQLHAPRRRSNLRAETAHLLDEEHEGTPRPHATAPTPAGETPGAHFKRQAP